MLLESEGNYPRLYFGSNWPLLLRSLNYLEERLDPAIFFRAGRKHILNLRFIERGLGRGRGGITVDLRKAMPMISHQRQVP